MELFDDPLPVTVVSGGGGVTSVYELWGQVTGGSVAFEIAGAQPTRTGLTISNPTASGLAVFLGKDAAVTIETGYQLDPGHSMTKVNPGAVYGITAGANVTLSYQDE